MKPNYIFYKSLFSIDYFSNMIKPVKGDDNITIHLGNDNPIKLEFDIANKMFFNVFR